MLNPHKWFKVLVWLIMFTLPALACGTSEPVRNRVSVYEPTSAIAENSTVVMTVTADTLNVRTGPGTEYPVIVGAELHRGDYVLCTKYDKSWCKHWQGWSHMSWMEEQK